ncbi:conserved oligomeric Golgi complex subunit 8 [Trichogramma pretiosum]|uniref:conserved oligomeric Golgi complex subunit 8 n=1 Tax=Trichogramma pretiosum TaxID=7493 RepID=UPI0006C9400C|nr:conserved oligomeric Golgi complex subunit 8 [Trichogramma pretiosum]XP_014235098.1 conserved oligomeric Golgi complex subunit 8 [Trichogramma pretiosum]XP_014235099.1 conserved oligomeric Golgi complex subunit 8 [Trichogramma pretiosum]XP_014235100.1 conserved oligomeric Golgi complex subunit 8 [Trichogramma pretiosum]
MARQSRDSENLSFLRGLAESREDPMDLFNYLLAIGATNKTFLRQESIELHEKKKVLFNEIRKLVINNYEPFINSKKYSRKILKTMSLANEDLSIVSDNIPYFVDECKLYCENLENLKVMKKVHRYSVTKTMRLQNILELPFLMRSCLNKKLCQEALELSYYVKNIGIRFQDTTLLMSTVIQTEHFWLLTIDWIFVELEKDMSIPLCLQLINFLRAIGIFTEAELRIRFIEKRNVWYQSSLKSISLEPRNEYLAKVIEFTRVSLFGIISQYKALFHDDSSHTFLDEISSMFFQWIEEKVIQFFDILECELPKVVFMEYIFDQCTYFALSFRRLGIDFTCRLSQIFVKVYGAKFEKQIIDNTKLFIENMESSYLEEKNYASLSSSITNFDNMKTSCQELYPFAAFCNGIFSSFNAIRLNTPFVLRLKIRNSLELSTHCLQCTIQEKTKQIKQKSFQSDELDRFFKLLQENCILSIQNSMKKVLPENQLVKYFGITQFDMELQV